MISLRSVSGILVPLVLAACGENQQAAADSEMPASPASEAGSADSENSVWTCSMHPQVRQPAPGLCPICEMDLIPVTEGEQGGLRQISLAPEAIALAGLEVTPAIRTAPVHTVPLLGRIEANQRLLTTISAWMAGRIEARYADTTGTRVQAGEHLLELYSPELRVLQQDLMLARRGNSQVSARALRERLRLLGLTPEQIDQFARADQAEDSVTITSPSGGLILDVLAREGDYVEEGEPLYRLVDLSSVWVTLEAYEDELPWLHYGQQIEFTTPSLPGEAFTGRVFVIEPSLDPQRRVARLRLEVDNLGEQLLPGMYVEAEARVRLDARGRAIDPSLAGRWISPMHPQIIADEPGECPICGMDLVPAEELGYSAEDAPQPLVVPASAVLPTGRRALVYVQVPDTDSPVFEGREVLPGPRVDGGSGNTQIILEGLEEGELVVSEAAFVLDSDLQLSGKPALMSGDDPLQGRSPLKAPEALRLAWEPVVRSAGRLGTELAGLVSGEDLKSVRAEARRLSELLGSIEPNDLDGDLAAVWDELSMRLTNSATALALADEVSSARREWSTLRRQLEQTNRHLGLPLPALVEPAAVDPALLAVLHNEVLPAYELLRHALADEEDWTTGERDALDQALVSLRRQIDANSLDLPGLNLSEVPPADQEPEPLRLFLKELTMALVPLVREHGGDQLGALYLVHCPMAFDNTGADWIATEAKVENPYFGSRMYRCGSVRATLSAPAP